jgi:hypothetical protein
MITGTGVIRISEWRGTGQMNDVLFVTDGCAEDKTTIELLMAVDALDHVGYAASDYLQSTYLNWKFEPTSTFAEAVNLAMEEASAKAPYEETDEDGDITYYPGSVYRSMCVLVRGVKEALTQFSVGGLVGAAR